MAEVTMSALEALMDEFYGPTTSNGRKREIELLLEQQGNQTDAFRIFLTFLASSANPYVSMFCLTSLEKIVNQRWIGLEASERIEIRNGLQSILERHHESCPAFIRNKLVKLLVDIARASWPQEYPEFFHQVFQMLRTTPVLGLTFVLTTSEELGCPRGQLTVARKAELRKLLLAEFPRIVAALIGILHAILDRHKRPVTPPPSPENSCDGTTSAVASFRRTNTADRKLCTGDDDWRRLDDQEREMAALSLACLGHVFSWAPLSLASSYGDPRSLLDAVFHCAAADTEGPVGEAALGVLVEIVAKNWVPVECHDFLGAVFRDTFRLLRHVVVNCGDKLEKVGPNYLDKLTEYMRVFLSLHIRRLDSANASANKITVDEFLWLLVVYTFAQPSTEKFSSALEIWNIFMDYLKADQEAFARRPENADIAMVVNHSDILVALSERILLKMQFRHNQAELEQLDDVKVDEDGETEWGRFLRECIELLARIGEINPDFAVGSVLQPLDDALTVYLQLESSVQFGDDGVRRLASVTGEHECKKLHCLLRDLASFLQAAGRFGEFFVDAVFRPRFSSGFGLLNKLCDTAALGSRARFYAVQVTLATLTEDFVEAMAQSLAALKPWCHWLAQANAELTRSADGQPGVPMSQRHFDDLLHSVLRTVITSIGPGVPQKIVHSAAHLLCTVTKVIRPMHLLESEEIKSFVERVPHMNLPCDTELLVHRAIANAIMLPGPGAGVAALHWNVRQENMNAFVRSLTADFLAIEKCGPLAPDHFGVIEKAMTLLTDLVLNVGDETTQTKSIVFRSIDPHLGIASVRLHACVLQSPPAAEAILTFFMNVFLVLRQPMGLEAAGCIVETILEAFGSAGVMESCFAGSGDLPSSRVRLVELFLAILSLDSGGRSDSRARFVAPTLALCLDVIQPQIASCPDVASPFYDVLANTLKNNWRWFFEKSIGGGEGNLVPGREPVFRRLMECIGSNFVQPDILLFRQSLAALESLNDKWKLFSKPIFKETMMWSFQRVLIEALLNGTHDLLQEEIVGGLYGLAETDFGDFFLSFLPAFVNSIPGLSEEQKEGVVRGFAQQTDLVSFKDNLLSFINDVTFYVRANSCMSNGA